MLGTIVLHWDWELQPSPEGDIKALHTLKVIHEFIILISLIRPEEKPLSSWLDILTFNSRSVQF